MYGHIKVEITGVPFLIRTPCFSVFAGIRSVCCHKPLAMENHEYSCCKGSWKTRERGRVSTPSQHGDWEPLCFPGFCPKEGLSELRDEVLVSDTWGSFLQSLGQLEFRTS